MRGVGWYEEQVLPRAVDLVLGRRHFAAIRARVAAGLSGDVVEIGFGSGRNVPHYPPAVARVRAVEPVATGWRLAAGRLRASAVDVEKLGLDGQRLPLPDHSVDHVLSTWTLCTIPDPARALTEIRRVLRPGGSLHFAEHGLSPDVDVASWQRRLTPIQRRVAGGCHLDRPIAELVAGCGLAVQRLATYYLPGPRAFGYMFEGVARNADGHLPAGRSRPDSDA